MGSPAYVIKSPRAETLQKEVREHVRRIVPEAPVYREYTMEFLARRIGDNGGYFQPRAQSPLPGPGGDGPTAEGSAGSQSPSSRPAAHTSAHEQPPALPCWLADEALPWAWPRDSVQPRLFGRPTRGRQSQRIARPLVIIWDRLQAHRSKAIRAWLQRHAKDFRIEWLPSYAPDLNPEEGCNGMVKEALLNAVPQPFRTSGARREGNSALCSTALMSSAPSSSMLGFMFSGLAEAV
ncbi:MAG TPA: transposase [Myxococcus sp.]|jgi:hypothetical protein|nr:transposase [Myxococcus sp.]